MQVILQVVEAEIATTRRYLMSLAPRLLNGRPDPAHAGVVRFGDPLLDAYLDLVGARARPNTLIATAYDLQVFFSIIDKPPIEVTSSDVLTFITAQRAARLGPRVVRLEDGEPGLSARTIKRRLASISGLYDYLVLRGEVAANPVPRGLAVRRPGQRVIRGVPLIRTPRTLPRIVEPSDVNVLLAALRTRRDQAMVLAMLLGGLRRCEVLGLRLQDLQPGERRAFVRDGKGGHQRLIPISTRFFTSVAAYLSNERPDTASDRVLVVLKGRHRGQPLTSAGLDEIVRGARRRAGLPALTCHHLRHTCLIRLREAGMALEALQARWAPLDRVHPHLHPPGQRLARRGVPSRRRAGRRADRGAPLMPAPQPLTAEEQDVVDQYCSELHRLGLRP
jgi:site-specific recombinase XerD